MLRLLSEDRRNLDELLGLTTRETYEKTSSQTPKEVSVKSWRGSVGPPSGTRQAENRLIVGFGRSWRENEIVAKLLSLRLQLNELILAVAIQFSFHKTLSANLNVSPCTKCLEITVVVFRCLPISELST